MPMKFVLIVLFNLWFAAGFSQVVFHEISIAEGADDAEQEGDFINITDIELDLGWSNGEMNRVGLLFRDVYLIAGSKTDSACLVFTLQQDFEDTLDVRIRIEKSGKPIGYNDSTALDFNREYLTASLRWKIKGGLKGDEIRSPNIQALVNNIMAREGWDETSSLNFLLEPANLSDSLSENEIQLYAFEQHIESRRPTLMIRIDQNKINGIASKTNAEPFSIFPNPADGRLIVKGITAISEIKIWSTSGVQIAQCDAESDVVVIDVSRFPSGIYMMSVQTKTGIYSQRFIKR